MPILNAIVHRIADAAGEASMSLVPATVALPVSSALDDLLAGVNDAFNAKPKAWGHFAETTPEGEVSSPLASELGDYLDGGRDFVRFSRDLAARIADLVSAHLSLSGDLLVLDHQVGDNRYLSLALLHHRQGFGIDDQLAVVPVRQLNLTQMSLAARINISQWQAGDAKPYLSWTHDRGGKKMAEGFAALVGAEESVDASGETRTLLKAFSDYVEQEGLPEEASREKTDALIDYASDQVRRGEPMTLEALSEVLDEQQPKAFYDHIRNADYGLSPEIPPDRKTLNQFRRFTGRAGGVSISFDSHLLGSSVEYDEDQDRLIIKQVPKQLREQLTRQG